MIFVIIVKIKIPHHIVIDNFFRRKAIFLANCNHESYLIAKLPLSRIVRFTFFIPLSD